MSYLAILDPRIFDDPSCKRAEYKVLWALGHRAQWRDPQWRGWCWPSLNTIAADTGFSNPTVIKALKRLEAGGYIKVVRTRKPDGSQAPNRYYVLHDDPRAYIAQPERLPEFQPGSIDTVTTNGVVKELDASRVVKEPEGGSKAAYGEGVDNGSKGPHGEAVYHNTNGTRQLEGEDSQPVIRGNLVLHRSRGEIAGPLPTAQQHLQTIFDAMGQVTTAKDAKAATMKAAVGLVFAHWQSTFGHKGARLDKDRGRRIEKRLVENEGDVSEILYAIDAAAKDDWINGKDPRSKGYDGIETVLRDRAQVEKFAQRCPGYKRGEPHPLLNSLQADHAEAQ